MKLSNFEPLITLIISDFADRKISAISIIQRNQQFKINANSGSKNKSYIYELHR